MVKSILPRSLTFSITSRVFLCLFHSIQFSRNTSKAYRKKFFMVVELSKFAVLNGQNKIVFDDEKKRFPMFDTNEVIEIKILIFSTIISSWLPFIGRMKMLAITINFIFNGQFSWISMISQEVLRCWNTNKISESSLTLRSYQSIESVCIQVDLSITLVIVNNLKARK